MLLTDAAAKDATTVQGCTHDAFIAHVTAGSVFDDHETQAGYCPACRTWVMRTIRMTRDGRDQVEHRPMTEKEIDRLEAIEGAYRRADQ